jgi:4-aminobutyrate aminotransferase-like enzyme
MGPQVMPLAATDRSVAQGDFVYRYEHVPIFRQAEGSLLVDTAGRRYLDAEAANGTVGLGFDRSILHAAVERCEGIVSLPSFCESELRLKVGTRLASLLGQVTGSEGRVAFELGGAQAVELAMRVVKANTPRARIVVFEGGYHGRSGYTASLSASPRYRQELGTIGPPTHRLPYPDCEQCRFGQVRSTCSFQCVDWIATTANREYAGLANCEGGDVAALVIEPVLNAGGIVIPDPDVLRSTVERFRGLGALIVVDETFSGFHRTGPIFGFAHSGIDPDVVVLGKALTNGITPLSCVWARAPLMDPDHFPPGTHSATFINNVLGLAVADCVLDRYEEWFTKAEDIARLERTLAQAVGDVVAKSGMAKSGHALGGVARVLLHDDRASSVVETARTVAVGSADGIDGLILASTGMTRNVIALNPPLNISTEHAERMHELLLATFAQMEGA